MYFQELVKGSKLGAHTIRHTVASMILDKTNSLTIVQHLLAHKEIATTQLYAHDRDNKLISKVSPLQLVKDSVTSQHATQADLNTDINNSDSRTSVIQTKDNRIDTFIDSTYSTITDGTTVRVKLNTEDLKLIRRAFVCLAQFGQITTDTNDSRILLKRFLRKSS